MEAIDIVKRFADFIEKEYYSQLLENIRKDNPFLVIDFKELNVVELDLANILLEKPEETIKAGEIAIGQFDLDDAGHVKLRFKNLPEVSKIRIVDSRVKHLGKFISLVGEVSRKSDVYLDCVAARFECPACANIINVLQTTGNFREPTRCGCGRKGKFTLLEKERVDMQELTIIDSVESVEEGDAYQELAVVLKGDLTSPDFNKRVYNINHTVIVNGYFEELEIFLKSGGKSTKSTKIFIANYVEPLLEQDKEFYPTSEEIEEFKRMSKEQGFYDKLLQGLAPAIYGHERVKEGILLQLVGGVRRKKHGNRFRRGDVHIGLIGDPSTGKSELILRSIDLLPRSMFVIGKGASAVGIAGGVKKNSYVEGYTADPGAMAMANRSILGIDELDKFDKDDIDALNTGMEQQFIKIDKGGVHAKYEAVTRVLIGANPKLGRFDPYAPLSEQFGIKPSVLSRLDLIFPMKDTPDEIKDKKRAEFILDSDTNNLSFNSEENIFYDTNKLRKYIQAVARLKPEFTEEAKQEIKNYYVKMRVANIKEEGISSVAIAPRQLQALERLAEASAKIFFRADITQEDSKRAIELMDYYLKSVAMDPETGKVDIDRINTGITALDRNYLHRLKEIIDELEDKLGKTIPIEDIIYAAKTNDVTEEKIKEGLEKLKRIGDIMEVRSGFISKI